VADSDPKPVSPVSHFKLDLGGPEGALLFSNAAIGAASLNTSKHNSVDANGNPVNNIGAGTGVQWGDLSVSRGIDTDHQLWESFKDHKDNGASPDNAKEIKLIGLNAKGDTLFTVNMTGAHINMYTIGAFDANGGGILTESAGFTYEDMTIE
jgi:T4-like virus tail tube protein gp19